MRVLGIDPSSTELGWAVIDGENVINFGVISTAKSEYHKRFDIIIRALEQVRQQYLATEIGCERAFKAPKRNTASLQVAVQAIKSWCKNLKIDLGIYSPGEWKAGAVGHGGADKDYVATMIKLRYSLSNVIIIPDHVSDAIGIATHHYSMLKLKERVK